MPLTQNQPFLPREPRRVFSIELELKGNLAFCWRGAGLGCEEPVPPAQGYWGESNAAARLQGRAAGA